MKLFVALLFLLCLGSTAMGQTTGEVQDNQSMPPVLVPEVLHPTSVGAILTSNRVDYANGKAVKLEFVVTNHSKSAVKYEFASAQLFDLSISDSTGKAIWHWSKNRVFGQLIKHVTLEPGQSVSFMVNWMQRDDDDHPVVGGVYQAYAELLPMDRPEITGNIISNSDNDPVNTGMPTIGTIESGAVNIKNTTPSVYAKVNFKIEPE